MYVSTSAQITIKNSSRWPPFDCNRAGLRLFGYYTDVWLEGCGMSCRLLYRTAGKPAPPGTVVSVIGSLGFAFPSIIIGSTHIQYAALPDIRGLAPESVPYVYITGHLTGKVRAVGKGDKSKVCFTVELHTPTPGALRCTCKRASKMIAELPRLYEQHFVAVVGQLSEQPGAMLNVTVLRFACIIYPMHVLDRDAEVIWPGPGGEDNMRVVGYYLPVDDDSVVQARQQFIRPADLEGGVEESVPDETQVANTGDEAPLEIPDSRYADTPGTVLSGGSASMPSSVPLEYSDPSPAKIWPSNIVGNAGCDGGNVTLAALSDVPPSAENLPAWESLLATGPSNALDPTSSLFGALGPDFGNSQQSAVQIPPAVTDLPMDVEVLQRPHLEPQGVLPVLPTMSPSAFTQFWAPLADDARLLPGNASSNYPLTSYVPGTTASDVGTEVLPGGETGNVWIGGAGDEMELGEGEVPVPQTGPDVSSQVNDNTIGSTSAIDDSASPVFEANGESIPEVLYSGPEDFAHSSASTQIHAPPIPMSPLSYLMEGMPEQYNWTSDDYDAENRGLMPEDMCDVYLHEA